MATVASLVLLGVALALLASWTDVMNALYFNSNLVRGKRVVVCGASTGIGEQIGVLFNYFFNQIITVKYYVNLWLERIHKYI